METILVTGASRGIGAAVAAEFAAHERRVILCARSADGLESTADAVSDAGGTPVVAPVDVTDEARVGDVIADTVSDTLEVVVPAAAIMPHSPGDRPLEEEEYDEFRRVLDTNLHGLFAVIRESVPLLSADGRVLVPSGSVAREPTAGMGAYGVSKAAAEGLARGFAADLDQTVGVVDPGLVATELTGDSGRDPKDVAGMFRWAATDCPAAELDGAVVGLREWKTATR